MSSWVIMIMSSSQFLVLSLDNSCQDYIGALQLLLGLGTATMEKCMGYGDWLSKAAGRRRKLVLDIDDTSWLIDDGSCSLIAASCRWVVASCHSADVPVLFSFLSCCWALFHCWKQNQSSGLLGSVIWSATMWSDQQRRFDHCHSAHHIHQTRLL